MRIDVRAGLQLEVAGREMSGPPATAPSRPRWGRYLLGLPALVLLAVLLVPMVRTTVWAFDSKSVFGHFWDVLTDESALTAAWHSLLWVGIAVALLALGYRVAVLSRHVQGLWRGLLYVLLLPFGISALAFGAVFRVIFDSTLERGSGWVLFCDG